MKAKTARNQMIVEFLENPKLTLKSVGVMFGISKQRVFAIKKAYQSHYNGLQRGRRQLLMVWVKSLFARYRKATRFH